MTPPFHTHLLRSEIVAGPGASAALASHSMLQTSASPLVLAGPHVSRTPFFAGIVEHLRQAQRSPHVISSVPSPALHAPVEALAAAHDTEHWDTIIAVGGGSTLDTAKAVSLLVARGGAVRDHAIARTGARRPELPQHAAFLPIVAIPTTFSGSEANMNASIRNRDTGERYSLADPGLLPRLIVLDPAALASQPRDLLLGSAFNALAHCIEGIYSTRHHVLADAQAKAAGRLLCSVLERPEDPGESGLTQMQLASVMAGALITEVYVGLHHAMCHAVVSLCAVQHAQANGALLPFTVDFNLRALASTQPDRVRAVAESLGVAPEGDALDVATACRRRLASLQESAGIPRRLSAVGVARDSLPALADYTLVDRALNTNPVAVERTDLLALFEESL